jgi:hypothetical protein
MNKGRKKLDLREEYYVSTPTQLISTRQLSRLNLALRSS